MSQAIVIQTDQNPSWPQMPTTAMGRYATDLVAQMDISIGMPKSLWRYPVVIKRPPKNQKIWILSRLLDRGAMV